MFQCYRRQLRYALILGLFASCPVTQYFLKISGVMLHRYTRVHPSVARCITKYSVADPESFFPDSVTEFFYLGSRIWIHIKEFKYFLIFSNSAPFTPSEAKICGFTIYAPEENWMVYRGLSFLAFVLFGSTPASSPTLPSVNWTGDTQENGAREAPCWMKRGKGGGRGAESHDRKRAWSTINYSILSACLVHHFVSSHTLKKKIQNRAVAKSYMTNGLLI